MKTTNPKNNTFIDDDIEDDFAQAMTSHGWSIFHERVNAEIQAEIQANKKGKVKPCNQLKNTRLK